VLVTGATGNQGGSVTRALLADRIAVRALVRDPASEKAQALVAQGVDLVQGDLTQPGTLAPAVDGVRAVFSVQTPDITGLTADAEIVQGRNLIDAALAASVPQFIHSSVSGAGEYAREGAGWDEGRWNKQYWESKAYADEFTQTAGFAHWTVIQPAFFMENFVRPSIYFANWTEDRLLTALRAETCLPLVAVQDIGRAVAAAIANRERFDGKVVQLAGDYLSMTEIAKALSDAWQTNIAAPDMSAEQFLAEPLPGVPENLMGFILNSQEWMNEIGSPARPDDAAELGIPTTTFAEWLAARSQTS
jgi:uncharacterized protein YbjT (DUF2867 family)